MRREDGDLARGLRKVFCAIFCPCHEREEIRRDVSVRFKGYIVQSIGGDKLMLTIKDDAVPGSGTYKFSFKDAKRKAARVDGVPTIVSSDPTVCDTIGPVTANGDGSFSAPFHLLDNPGTSQITISADVDLGEGMNSKDFVDVVNIIPGDAASIEGDFGTITPDTP